MGDWQRRGLNLKYLGDWQRRGLNLKYLERIPTRYSSLVQLDPGHLGLARIEVRGQDSFIVRIMRVRIAF